MRNLLIALVSLFIFFAIFLSGGILTEGGQGTFHEIGNLSNSKKVIGPSTKKNVNDLANKWTYHRSPVIYLVPHADDEILTYGVDILNSIRMGRQVQLILMSPSISSSVFDIINGRNSYGRPVFDRILHRYHDPIKEKYQSGYLTRDKFGEARIREFQQASIELGVPASNITFAISNSLNTNDISNIIRKEINMYPHAEFRTMSKEDFHPEHAILGKVLQTFVDSHQIEPSQVRYLISIYTDRFDKTCKQRLGNQAYFSLTKKEVTEHLINPLDKKRLQAGIDVYRKWDPSHGWYAIGLHSVADQFFSLEIKMYTKYYTAEVSPSTNIYN
jgi:LmbE family N-acetylglucosaminyl deacetylase